MPARRARKQSWPCLRFTPMPARGDFAQIKVVSNQKIKRNLLNSFWTHSYSWFSFVWIYWIFEMIHQLDQCWRKSRPWWTAGLIFPFLEQAARKILPHNPLHHKLRWSGSPKMIDRHLWNLRTKGDWAATLQFLIVPACANSHTL